MVKTKDLDTWTGEYSSASDSQLDTQSKDALDPSTNVDNKTHCKGTSEAKIPHKSWKQYVQVAVCGTALLSDGYCMSSIGTVITILKKLYPKETKAHHTIKKISMISYVGTIVGQLFFGIFSDALGRKIGMIASSAVLVASTALCSGAYGYHGSIRGMLQALIAYRFFLGIGIGAEFVCGSISASESSNEVQSGARHAIFVIVTDTATCMGHILGALIPYILACIFGQRHLRIVWRLSIGCGIFIPIVFLILRIRMKEVKTYVSHRVSAKKIPWLLAIKMYGIRLFLLSMIWFANGLIISAFSLYSSTIIKGVILPHNASMARTFGWTVLTQSFSLPGSLLGAYFSDVLGPKYCLILGASLQGMIGFFMSGFYHQLVHKVAGFCVLYGLFLSMGEFGAKCNIRLLASKTSPTAIRGLYCGIAVTTGRLGSIAGIYLFGGDQLQRYFYAASGISFFIVLISLFLPNVDQSCIETEDERFLQACKLGGIHPIFEQSDAE
ncbi:glycerophosphodiester transporter [Schizosaccharomyces cryophilus OY26]|uniref:Glycerophosphodiester transporter n=1 Tax=Schizosaccharomyces cryophilus (strain OY26 / ATCC MYA-4695 / CBS 11777 / NBRC 106824 / NRRL Y48691) TaxID=653667 RepID=S9VVB5_SCHCR|nr:glycerophosphodiester transporter [Schizosaccharomyces cryophilus OY26]EPY50124.1 glycerophosphodiester transporter [Schizosaccharomyces cryophilus OY26]